jgi:hypothetical protein
MPDEILRRLKEDQAGLGFPVELSKRRLHEYIAEHREKHGPPPDPALERIEPDTIAKLKARIVARAAREIDAIERKHKGKLKPDDATTMRRLYSFLHEAERREETAQTRRRQPSRQKRAGAPAREQESVLERLEREEAEAAQAASASPTCKHGDPHSPPCDGDGCNYEDDPETGTAGMLPLTVPPQQRPNSSPTTEEERAGAAQREADGLGIGGDGGRVDRSPTQARPGSSRGPAGGEQGAAKGAEG